MKAPTVHLNTVRKRKRKEVTQQMLQSAQRLADSGQIAGYAIIVFDERGGASSRFDTGGLMPLWAFPGAVEKVLDCATNKVAEDYVRPLRDTPWSTK